jgi:lipoate-protein ligase B
MMVVQKLGRVPYVDALRAQEERARLRIADAVPDALLLLEHPPTVTFGRRAAADDLAVERSVLERRGVSLFSVGRGGRATYHGPGQLVGYPIVRLSREGRGVRRFVGALENALVATARALGVAADRRVGHPGVWVEEAKLASIGIEVHRGVVRHGFALNVDMDLGPFGAIVPCGVPGLPMTDLSRAAGRSVTIAEATARLLDAWAMEFGEIREEGSDA